MDDIDRLVNQNNKLDEKLSYLKEKHKLKIEMEKKKEEIKHIQKQLNPFNKFYNKIMEMIKNESK